MKWLRNFARRPQSSPAEDVDEILRCLDDKMKVLDPSVGRETRDLKALDVSVIRLAWVAQNGACTTCKKLAEKGPYAKGVLEVWPGTPSVKCLNKKRRCRIEADPSDWQKVFPRA